MPISPEYLDKIQRRPIDELKRFGRQARTHDDRQIGVIAASIQQFSFCEPVIVDEAGHLLIGYGRVAAAKRLGLTEVPTLVVSHLTAAEKRAYVIASNRSAEKAGWDKEILELEFKELSALDLDFSLDVTGFSFEEREALVFGQDQSEEGEDALPALPERTVSVLGDLWICGEHWVLCGDALSPDSYARLLVGELVQAVFTDPPYNVPTQGHITSNSAHGDFVQASGEMSPAEFQDFLTAVLLRVFEVLEPGGLAYACIDWRSIAELIAAGGEAGLELLNLIVWAKTVGGQGSFYRSQHELILLLKKAGAAHRNNVQLGRHGRNRTNVWTYDGVNGFGAEKQRLRALHPTVKSCAMVKDALLDCTRPGDLVCDMFSGSGTTLIACEKIGRRARVMDLDPRYVDVTVRRFEDFTGQAAVHAVTGETFVETAKAHVAPNLPPVRQRTRAA